MLSYQVLIRQVESGQQRWYTPPLLWGDDEQEIFFWTDGNFGCDCNLGTFFARAVGRQPSEESQCTPADGPPKYTIQQIKLADGRQLSPAELYGFPDITSQQLSLLVSIRLEPKYLHMGRSPVPAILACFQLQQLQLVQVQDGWVQPTSLGYRLLSQPMELAPSAYCPHCGNPVQRDRHSVVTTDFCPHCWWRKDR